MSKTKFSEIELKDHLSFIFMMIYQFIMILLFTCGVLFFRIIEIIDGFITKEEIKKELITNSNESNKVDSNESNKVDSNESNVEENSLKLNKTSSTNKSPHVSSKEIKKPVIIDNHDLLLNKTNDMVNPQ
ncbi:hypothetical protein A0H76_1777 [Hepatospora eriocheir]|uniref:Uncharacterized protein n=1 Tax=Hepatospora eriocheir TaxID=1081669 RepID=A0A1X0Q5M7_9MICR|nr:hypothetical protein A0H76_1777 [Hepatospora eriocheir]